MNNIKDKISTKLADLSDFWETHTAPMNQTTLASAPDASSIVAGMDPTRVRFYLQVINRLPKFNQILREYNLGANVRSSWYSAIRDINSKGKFISGLPDYRQKRMKRNINDQLKQNPLTEKFAYGQNKDAIFQLDPQTYKTRQNLEALKEQGYMNQSELKNVQGVNNLLKQNINTVQQTSTELTTALPEAAKLKAAQENNTTNIAALKEALTPKDVVTTGGKIGNFFEDKVADYEDITKQIDNNAAANAAFNTTQNREFSGIDKNGVKNGVKNKAITNTESAKFDELLRGKDNIISSIEEHPIYGPKEQTTTPVDRSIFCALTFIIRGIALYLVDWAFSIRMVSTLTEGFFFYIAMYWILFGLICVLVNTNIDIENDGFANPFKAIFYYLNTDVNSSMRIWIHLFIQFMLFPIILFISDGSINPEQDTYKKTKQVQYVINNISLLMWFLTSIIAFRI